MVNRAFITGVIGVLLLSAFIGAQTPRPHVWIFSGQSNMQKISGAAQSAVGEVVKKHEHGYRSIYSAAPGKPIEAWLDESHRDHVLWKKIVTQVAEAKKAGGVFKGLVWYQGESNVKEHAGKYQGQLRDLVRRVRKLTGEKKLPAIIVQIGSATAYAGRDWACGVIREAQRRLAEADDSIAVVSAIDAELGDYTVHLSGKGSALVAARIASAADRLAYGAKDAYWGPQVDSVRFFDKNRKHVLVIYKNVCKDLKLREGVLAGFAASVKTRLPGDLSMIEDATAMGRMLDDCIFARHARIVGANQLVLEFAEPLNADARLSYAAGRNAQYGPHRRWRLEFCGVADASGHESPAFVLIPIGSPTGSPTVELQELPEPKPVSPWRRIAVNCVGRYSPGVNKPTDLIGPDAGGLRQKYWNPASAGIVPNLFDHRGIVTGVGFDSSVWYMNPVSKGMPTPDHQMMYTWNAHNWHSVTGLDANESFDVVVYIDLPADKAGKTTVLLASSSAKYRISNRSLRELDKAGKQAREFRSIVLKEPIGQDNNFQGRYFRATKDNGWTGNYIVLENVKPGVEGRIFVTSYSPKAWRTEGIRHKQYLSGLQIIRRVRPDTSGDR